MTAPERVIQGTRRHLFLAGIFSLAILFFFSYFFNPGAFAAAPGVVTNVVPTPANGQVSLTWTNPSSVDFTGTMVRYSTTTFPASVSDGTLASDVAGAVSGTSSLTVTGLTNGTIYYFSLFAHNAVPEYANAVNAQQLVMPVVFSDDFESLTLGSVGGQNGWAIVAGTWNVIDTTGEQTLKSGTENLTFDQGRVLNGGVVNRYSNQMVRADWRGTGINAPGQLFLRTQSVSADAGGYTLTQAGGVLRISYKSSTGSSFTSLATGAFTPLANTWYVYEFSVQNDASGLPVLRAYVWTRGSAKPSTPTVAVTDTVNRFPQGGFSVGKSSTVQAEYDNVIYSGMIGDASAKVLPGDTVNTISWTNPNSNTYVGTSVRVSTSAYPSTPSDGTLVANVTGSSGATSSTTHTGLTNGTLYYYTLFPYDDAGVYGTPISMSQVANPVLFTDTFDALSTGTVVGQNGWTTEGGTWTIADVSSERVLSAPDSVSYLINMAVNGGSTTLDQILSYRFKSDLAANTAGYAWLRRQANNDGYLIWHNGNAWTISYQSGATFTTLAAAATTVVVPQAQNTWTNVEASIINNGSDLPVISVYAWKEGSEKPLTPTLSFTDSVDRFPNGTFALARNTGTLQAYFDDVHFAGTVPPPPPSPTLSLTSPAAEVVAEPDTATLAITDEQGTFYIPYIQTSTTLNAVATLDSVPEGGGIRFILNEGLPGEQTIDDLVGPAYTAAFSGLAKAEYTLDAYEILGDGITLSSDPLLHDHRDHVGIGDIIAVIGDSTSDGTGGTAPDGVVTNWLEADAGSLSSDHRNFPQSNPSDLAYKESFLSDLNDTLSGYYGYPVFLMNEAHIGIRASNYQSNVMISNWTTRELALSPTKWIVALGNGDSQVLHSAATYRADMESLFTTLVNTYGASYDDIYVPYPFYDSRADIVDVLATYPAVIDAMRLEDGLGGGADFFYTFQHYKPAEYSGVHPNVTGYERLARLWGLAFMQPTLSAPSVSGRQITVNWNDLSAFESSIAGYQVLYGISADNLNQSVTVGNVTSATLTNLNWNTTYYFAVKGFDNDPFVVSYTDQSATSSALTTTGTSTVNPSAISGNTTEAGGTASFTVVLSSQPASNVVVPVSSSDTTEGTVSPSSLTFTSENWSVPQTVLATGVNDAVDDGNIAYSIVLGAATSSDVTFSGVDATDVSITNTDNDTAGFLVSAISGNTTEAGGTAGFTVVLTSQPSDSVSIPVASSDTTEGTVAGETLTFSTENWSTPQMVIVTGAEDALDDGTVSFSVVLGAATSSDLLYSGIDVGDVSVSNTDNDTAGILVTQTDGTTLLAEGGATDTYTIVLATQPFFDVIVTVSPDDQMEVSATELTFTSSNWNSAQTITVSAQDDAVSEGTHAGVVSHTATSSDAGYNGVSISSVTATVTDNDTAGITLTPSDGSTHVEEAGVGDEATLVLTSKPTANVTVTFSYTTSDLSVTPSTFAFSPLTWDIPQSLSLSGVDNQIREGGKEEFLTANVVSDDLLYHAFSISPLLVSIGDDERTTSGGSSGSSSSSSSPSSGEGSSDTDTLTISHPLAGDLFLAGSSINVSWSAPSSLAFVSIDISLDGGLHWNALASNRTATAGSEAVVLPNVAGTAVLRLRGTTSGVVVETVESGAFTIALATEVEDESTVTESSPVTVENSQTFATIVERVEALPGETAVHGLVKLADDGDVTTQADSVLYYVGADGLRHAFASAAIFHSWFCDTASVEILSAADMSAIGLGTNVIYRPGSRLVKIVTDPRVYAVDRGGVLRWIVSEELAAALYGSNWNYFVDDISETSFPHYAFGTPILDVSQYDRTAAGESVLYPSDTMSILGYTSLTSQGLSCEAPSSQSTIATVLSPLKKVIFWMGASLVDSVL